MTNKSRILDFPNLTVRETGPGLVEISFRGPAGPAVEVYAGLSPEKLDATRPMAVVEASPRDDGCLTLRVDGLTPGRRYYFRVARAGAVSTVTAARRVGLEGAYNFRDLGGYETVEGRRVKWGAVFRSDGLHRLTDPDLAKLSGLKVALIVDLRSSEEASRAPDRLPDGGLVRHKNMSVQTGELNFVTAMERVKRGDDGWLTPGYMARGYRRNLAEYGPVWAELFSLAARKENLPLVFHCTGGKDRAGTAAALLLLALGVPEETVVADHQLSNVYIADMLPTVFERLRAMEVDPEKLRPYFTAPLDGIMALLEDLTVKYGSIDHYLLSAGGLDPDVLERLREELLEDGPS